MPLDLMTQIKFMMDGYAHQILENQMAMMEMLGTAYPEDARQTLKLRMQETRSMLDLLNKRRGD